MVNSMQLNNGGGVLHNMRRLSAVGVASAVLFVALSGLAVWLGAWKLLGISWVAFVAMAGGALLGARTRGERPGALVWGYGLASGAMITSAAVFLVPQAIGISLASGAPQYGGFGIALGLLAGFGSHTLGHRLAHLDLPLDRSAAELSAHALSAGAIIGLIYGNMPELGPVLGLAIVSHKGPAGYAAAGRLVRDDGDPSVLLLPAVGVGLTAILASVIPVPPAPAVQGVVFGFAAGVFVHVAMDFLPRCELGSEVHDVLQTEGDAHAVLDRLRVHAVASTSLGGLVVFVVWLALAA
jgi:ZIP family zinc transporter